MDKRVARHLREHGLASLMNATKWRELGEGLGAIREGLLPVRSKYLLDDAPMPGFACLDWCTLHDGDTAAIEWLEVDPRLRTFRGHRVPDQVEDLGAEVEAVLRRVGAPYSVASGVFRIWAYVRPGQLPDLGARHRPG